jgi:hypothetical protein
MQPEPNAAAAATYLVLPTPRSASGLTGLTLHAGLVAVNRYRGKGRVFLATVVAASN